MVYPIIFKVYVILRNLSMYYLEYKMFNTKLLHFYNVYTQIHAWRDFSMISWQFTWIYTYMILYANIRQYIQLYADMSNYKHQLSGLAFTTESVYNWTSVQTVSLNDMFPFIEADCCNKRVIFSNLGFYTRPSFTFVRARFSFIGLRSWPLCEKHKGRSAIFIDTKLNLILFY